MSVDLQEKQNILRMSAVKARLEHDVSYGFRDRSVPAEKKIRGRVKKQMEKSQREYYLMSR